MNGHDCFCRDGSAADCPIHGMASLKWVGPDEELAAMLRNLAALCGGGHFVSKWSAGCAMASAARRIETLQAERDALASLVVEKDGDQGWIYHGTSDTTRVGHSTFSLPYPTREEAVAAAIREIQGRTSGEDDNRP